MSLLPSALLLLALGAEEPLTEEVAVKQALAHSPALKALSSRVEEASAEIDVARRWPNPELRVSNLRSDHLLTPALKQSTFPDNPFEKTKIELRWAPPELGLRAERKADAEMDRAQAAAQRSQGEREVAARVRGLHATALSLERQRALAQSAVEQRDRLRKLAQGRLDRSGGTAVEQSQAELDYLDALSAQQEVETRRALALAELRAQLGLEAGASLELSAQGVPACEAPGDGAALLEQAVRASNRLMEFPSRLSAVDAERAHRTLQLVPFLTFMQLSYVFATDIDPQYLALQFGLSLPLFDWKTADRRALGAKRARIEEERSAEVMDLERRVRRAAAEQAEQAALLKRLGEAEAILDGVLKRARKALEAGAATDQIQVTQLEVRAVAARRASERAGLECRLRQIELGRLVGTAAGPGGGGAGGP